MRCTWELCDLQHHMNWLLTSLAHMMDETVFTLWGSAFRRTMFPLHQASKH